MKKVFHFISLLSKSQTLSCVYAQERRRRRRHLTLQIINSHTGIRRFFSFSKCQGRKKVAPHNYNWTRLIAFTARKFKSKIRVLVLVIFLLASRCLIENSSRLPYFFVREGFIVFFFPSRGRDFGSFRKGAIDSLKERASKTRESPTYSTTPFFEKKMHCHLAHEKKGISNPNACSCYYPQFCAVIILPNSANGKK